MKKKIIALLLALTMVFSACDLDEELELSENQDTQDTTQSETASEENSEVGTDTGIAGGGSWAFYWYLCGSDLESQNGFATTDLEEALSVELPENVTMVVQTGGASQWQNEVISADEIGRYVISKGEINQVDAQELDNMGDPETLASFLSFCNENYPADHKMVIFWDHGGGSTSGAALDENYEGDCLTIPELREAFEATCTPSADSQPYDIIGFDTCLMATVDVAGAFKDIGRYLVASEETEPGIGWCYDGWLGALKSDPNIAPADLGKAICDTYYSACEQYELADDVTLSVTDLSKMDNVLSKYDDYANEALVNAAMDYSFYGKYGRAVQKSENYGGNTDKSGYTDMADLGDIAANCAKILPETSKPLIDAISEAVLYQVKGQYRSHANGLSCYYSFSCDEDNFKNYKKATTSKPLKYFYEYGLTGDLNDKGIKYIQKLIDGEMDQPEQNMPDEKALKDHAVDIKDNVAVLDIGAENAKLLTQVNFELVIIDNGTMVYLGTDNDIESDWENGVFKDNFRGVWGGIDGHLVYMEVTGSNDEYTSYSVPVKLNGEDSLLTVVYNYSTEKFEILGARSAIENGVADKDFKKLKAGDEITTIHYAYNLEAEDAEPVEFEMDTFTVTDETVFDEIDLGDENYALEFEMITADGKRYTSDVKLFTVQDGVLEYQE